MAHSLSANKRIRQGAKRRSRNRRRKDQVKGAVKAFEVALREGKLDVAGQELKAASKKLDQVSAKGTIHRNTASRKKSRMAIALNKAAKAKA